MRGSLRGADFFGCTAALWVSRKPDRESNMISLGELMGMTPAELYIKSFSQPYEQKVLVGHAIVSLIDSFDRAASRGIPDSPSGGVQGVYSVCGFTIIEKNRNFYVEEYRTNPIEGVVRQALVDLYPSHATLLTSREWQEEDSSFYEFGPSFSAALEHPYTRAMLGIDNKSDVASLRRDLRYKALEIVDAPRLEGNADKMFMTVCRSGGVESLSQRLHKVYKHHTSSFNDAEGLTSLGNSALRALFTSEEEAQEGHGSGMYVRRRLRFLSHYPQLLSAFGTEKPNSKTVSKLRSAVDNAQTDPEIVSEVIKAIGADMWHMAYTDTANFLLEE